MLITREWPIIWRPVKLHEQQEAEVMERKCSLCIFTYAHFIVTSLFCRDASMSFELCISVASLSIFCWYDKTRHTGSYRGVCRLGLYIFYETLIIMWRKEIELWCLLKERKHGWYCIQLYILHYTGNNTFFSSGNNGRGESTSNSKQKMFDAHMHFEASFSCLAEGWNSSGAEWQIQRLFYAAESNFFFFSLIQCCKI